MKIDLGVFVFAVVLGLLVCGVIYGVNNCEQMFNQCLADGHKQYECYGMIYHR